MCARRVGGQIQRAPNLSRSLRDPACVGQLFLVRAGREVRAQPAPLGERADLRRGLARGLRLGREDLAVPGLVRRTRWVGREDEVAAAR